MKTCTRCDVPKELWAFSADRRRGDGRRARCRECEKLPPSVDVDVSDFATIKPGLTVEPVSETNKFELFDNIEQLGDEPTNPEILIHVHGYVGNEQDMAREIDARIRAAKPEAAELEIPKEALRKKLPAPNEMIIPWEGDAPRSIISDGDNHYRIADPRVEAAKLLFAADRRPDVWINVGDQYDLHSVSRFEKEPERVFDQYTLQHEFDSALPYWRAVCAMSKRVEFILGNHEFRLNKIVMANSGLYGLRAMNWHTLAGIPESVTVHPYGAQRQIGLGWFEHGDGGRSSTSWVMNNRGGAFVVRGHWHHEDLLIRTMRDSFGHLTRRTVFHQGHGSDLNQQSYAGTAPDWQHGFTFIEHHTTAGKTDYALHPISVTNGKILWDGKVYDGGQPHPWSNKQSTH